LVTNCTNCVLEQINPTTPSLDHEQLEVLREAYGIEVAEADRLPSEFDVVTCATDRAGDRYVVKVSGADAEGAIRWQHDLLERAAANPRLAVPAVRRTAGGDDLVALSDGRILRVYGWLDGTILARLPNHSPQLLRDWGAAAAELATTLKPVVAPGSCLRPHVWDVAKAPESVAAAIGAVADPVLRAHVATIMGWFDRWVAPRLDRLPRSVVHQDLNDHNVLAAPDDLGQVRLSGVLDFSDALETVTIGELTVALAYAMPRRTDPLTAAMHVVAGYSERRELSDDELAAVYPLAAARLCVNAVTWTARTVAAENPYGEDRMRHTLPTLERLVAIPPRLAEAALRQAAGRPRPGPRAPVTRAPEASRVFATPLVDADLSPASDVFDDVAVGEDPTPAIRGGEGTAAGRHLTARFSRLVRRTTRGGESATLTLGVDAWPEPGSVVRAPAAATAEAHGDDWVVLASDAGFSRWSGVRPAVTTGERLEPAQALGTATAAPVTIALFDDREVALAAPVVVEPSLAEVWREVSHDPSGWLGIERPSDAGWDRDRVVRSRGEHFARSQRAYYADPINLVRGAGTLLIDDLGRTYLDAINNVTHVGHANPAVADAIARQSRRLNTNSRFVYPSLARYAERLAALLPDPLEVVFLVCTGSEANDLALRISRQVTGREDVIVIDGAYHGNTTAVTGISPNRYKGAGGAGAPPTTHEVVTPDRYRGPFGYDDEDAGRRYADDVGRAVAGLKGAGREPAAFIAESLMGTAGTIVHPDGYLAGAFADARAAGALCIADEVQVGFGRLGSGFWGFAGQGVIPDIVTMGKPIGNGHPLAAVVTTREIADAFDQGMKYFNTFGGNPVSCEVGMAVLDEIRDRGLERNAAEVGDHFQARLRELGDRHAAIGDVRGQGLYLGVDLVRDRVTREPDKALAARVAEQMKDEGVIVIPTGTHDNVLKIKPPMVFSRADVDLFCDALDRVLTDGW
jgi:4-aminobutyrate aminotransferase-like enzyme/Ser/Thr protein kinase RdoA (MazF antagonist)